jgi:hypothetical protein
MPFQYVRDDAKRRITVILTDPLTVAERIAAVERQLADDAWRYGLIIDARSMLQFAPHTTEMRAVVERVGELVAAHGPRGPVAIVSRHSGVIGAGAIYNYFGRQKDSVEVFWDMDEALKFLDSQTGV